VLQTYKDGDDDDDDDEDDDNSLQFSSVCSSTCWFNNKNIKSMASTNA